MPTLNSVFFTLNSVKYFGISSAEEKISEENNSLKTFSVLCLCFP